MYGSFSSVYLLLNLIFHQVAAPLLEDWRLIVKNGLMSLDRFWSISKSDSVNYYYYSDGLDSDAFFYASAVGRADCISFSNVLKNFEIVAFHLAYLLKICRLLVCRYVHSITFGLRKPGPVFEF